MTDIIYRIVETIFTTILNTQIILNNKKQQAKDAQQLLRGLNFDIFSHFYIGLIFILVILE